jgi:hypothetical protein
MALEYLDGGAGDVPSLNLLKIFAAWIYAFAGMLVSSEIRCQGVVL